LKLLLFLLGLLDVCLVLLQLLLELLDCTVQFVFVLLLLRLSLLQQLLLFFLLLLQFQRGGLLFPRHLRQFKAFRLCELGFRLEFYLSGLLHFHCALRFDFVVFCKVRVRVRLCVLGEAFLVLQVVFHIWGLRLRTRSEVVVHVWGFAASGDFCWGLRRLREHRSAAWGWRGRQSSAWGLRGLWQSCSAWGLGRLGQPGSGRCLRRGAN
jgi:hypothetical protein